MALRVGLVAGEASGDTLGADLINALRRIAPDTQFFGVAGPKMQAAGCEAWEPAESFAVMGLFEVLTHLPRLMQLLSKIKRMMLTVRPDVFVGIDAPDTNLRIARTLHAAGIPTVQYVSPQVWAWRQGRAKRMRESVDLVLCLLPFEKSFYDQHGIRAEFVGHPLADAIPLEIDQAAARRSLGLAVDGQVIALLPGSRRGEVTRLTPDFVATARWLAAQRPALSFVAPMANAAARAIGALTLGVVALGAERVALVGGVGEAMRPYFELDVVARLSPPLYDPTDGAILFVGGIIAPQREAAQ